jgi:hypothetical protein
MNVKEVEGVEGLVERRCVRFRGRVGGRDVMVGEVAGNINQCPILFPSVIIVMRLMRE